MINRRKTKQISIGNVKIGGNAPISVQSMCNTDTRDVDKTLEQITELASAGCEIIRLAVLNKDAALAIKDIVKKSPIPVVADIHFDYRLALECIENGIQPKTLQKILGHSTLSVTMDLYVHVTDDHIFEEIEKLNNAI